MLSAFGVGAMAAGLAGAAARRRLGPTRLAAVAFACIAAALLIAAGSPGAAGIALAMAIAGTGWVWGFSTLTVATQMSAPPGLEGRALALYQMAAFSGMTAGSWSCGAIAGALGMAPALAMAGAVAAIGAGWCLGKD